MYFLKNRCWLSSNYRVLIVDLVFTKTNEIQPKRPMTIYDTKKSEVRLIDDTWSLN